MKQQPEAIIAEVLAASPGFTVLNELFVRDGLFTVVAFESLPGPQADERIREKKMAVQESRKATVVTRTRMVRLCFWRSGTKRYRTCFATCRSVSKRGQAMLMITTMVLSRTGRRSEFFLRCQSVEMT